MGIALRIFIVVFLVMLITLPFAIGAGNDKTPVIIGFKDKPTQADKDAIRGHGGEIKYQYTIINAIAAGLPLQAIEAVRKNPNVEYIELDGKVQASEQVLPWGIDRIDAELVHPSNKGTGVRVAIIDTGIDYTHPDLDGNYKGGYNFVSGNDKPMDDSGHGTHVAGIVAAEDNGIGVVGVAPEASLYAVKVLDSSGSGTFSNVIAGIDWSVRNGMQIISMSLGANSGSTALQDAVDSAYNAGIVIVAAAGNDGNYAGTTDTVDYPARYDSVIAVAATDSSDSRAIWYNSIPITGSSTGPQVELSAPGASIYSTVPTGACGLCDPSGYRYLSGTSMATPHVTGTAALIIASNPELTNVEIRWLLRNTSRDLGLGGRDELYGFGLINASAAAPVRDITPPAQVTGVTVTTVDTNHLSISWNANTEPDFSHYRVYRSMTLVFSTNPADLVASSTTNSFIDSGLAASTTYYYRVAAVDAAGNQGESSNESGGTTAPDTAGPATVNIAVSPNPTGGASSVTLTARIDDSITGNSSIDAAEYFFSTVGIDGSGIPMSASDGSFSSSSEGVVASIDVSGRVAGDYTLYVHGKDAVGNWGAMNTVLLGITEKPANTMHIGSIVMSKTTYKSKGYYTYAVANVTIVDAAGAAVEGAKVSGHWTGLTSDTDAGITGTGGWVALNSNAVKSAVGTFNFTVDSVTRDGWSYDKTANNMTGNSITV